MYNCFLNVSQFVKSVGMCQFFSQFSFVHVKREEISGCFLSDLLYTFMQMFKKEIQKWRQPHSLNIRFIIHSIVFYQSKIGFNLLLTKLNQTSLRPCIIISFPILVINKWAGQMLKIMTFDEKKLVLCYQSMW